MKIKYTGLDYKIGKINVDITDEPIDKMLKRDSNNIYSKSIQHKIK